MDDDEEHLSRPGPGGGRFGGDRPAVRAVRATMRFGSQVSVEDVSFDVEPGAIFGFIGPSGCGKTTTVRLLTGLHRPTSGRVEVLGQEPASFTRRHRERIGYLPQRSVLYPELSLAANVRFVAGIYGMSHDVRRRVAEVLEFMELGEHAHKPLRTTSGGMQRRAALAAALVHAPELLFLDEPTAGLDPLLRTKLWAHFDDLRQGGSTLFVTTQYVDEATRCDRVALMVEGRLVALDTPTGLRRRAMGGDIVRAVAAAPLDEAALQRLGTVPGVLRVDVDATRPAVVDVVVEDATRAMGPVVTSLEPEPGLTAVEHHLPAFDDVFTELVTQHRAEEADRLGRDGPEGPAAGGGAAAPPAEAVA
jgi:ABC-2 type transport system ATP-binding protein